MSQKTYNSIRLIQTLEKFRTQAEQNGNKVINIELIGTKIYSNKWVAIYKVAYPCGHSEELIC